MTHPRINEAEGILQAMGMPPAQVNERSAFCLLALLDLRPDTPWQHASAPLVGIAQMMDWMRDHYGKVYAVGSRESVRRQTMHQFVAGGIALYNPDNPGRPVNSPRAVYQITPEARAVVRLFNTPAFARALREFGAQRPGLADQYAMAREMQQVPVVLRDGQNLLLSPGEHSQLIKAVIEVFAAHFVPGSSLLYAGDTGQKVGYFDQQGLERLGVVVDKHGKMPDVVLYDEARNWLILAEAASSHGPVDGKRHAELSHLFQHSTAGLVFVSAFPDRQTMRRYLADIAWETEVWVADAPGHMMHFNGVRFLGPYDTAT